MFYRLPGCLLGVLWLVAGLSCSRRAPEPEGRIAILRLENLGSDPAEDWIGRALSEIVAADMSAASAAGILTSAKLHGVDRALGRQISAAPGISTERTQAILAGASRLVYGQYVVRGGRIDIQVTIEDARTNRTLRTLTQSGSADNVIAAADELARKIQPNARPYVTRSQEAVRGWIAGMEQGPAGAADALARAIAADPSFVPPYTMLAQVKLEQQDRGGAENVLAQALSHSGSMAEADRARIALELAVLRGDTAARRPALEALARATPDDASVWRALAEDANFRRQYREAVAAFRKAAALEPGDPAILNALGYAAAYAGDLAGARQALEQYARLRPAEANPLDSMGDVHLRVGRLAEAEQYYTQAYQKDPSFLAGGTLFKAAWAHLLTGDVAGADAIARRYLDARKQANDPVLDYREAQWLWITGRRQEGVQRLTGFCRRNHSGALLDYAARGYAQVSIWNLSLGDRSGAAANADLAMSLARPASGAVAVMARFLTQPPASASEWTARAERSFPQPTQAGFRSLTLAYALLFAKEYAAAAQLLQKLEVTGVPGADDSLPVLLAWAELENNRVDAAGRLLEPNPLPAADGIAPFAVLAFPRQVYLRGWLAEKQGNRDAAIAAYRTFLQLSGPAALQWGEERHAREFK